MNTLWCQPLRDRIYADHSRDQLYHHPARQLHILGCFNSERIPTVGESKDLGIRRHQVDFETMILPATDGSITGTVATEAQPEKLLLDPMIYRKGRDTCNQINIERNAYWSGGGVSNQQTYSASSDKYELIAQRTESRSNQFNL
jgi:hypothetical protein